MGRQVFSYLRGNRAHQEQWLLRKTNIIPNVSLSLLLPPLYIVTWCHMVWNIPLVDVVACPGSVFSQPPMPPQSPCQCGSTGNRKCLGSVQVLLSKQQKDLYVSTLCSAQFKTSPIVATIVPCYQIATLTSMCHTTILLHGWEDNISVWFLLSLYQRKCVLCKTRNMEQHRRNIQISH